MHWGGRRPRGQGREEGGSRREYGKERQKQGSAVNLNGQALCGVFRYQGKIEEKGLVDNRSKSGLRI